MDLEDNMMRTIMRRNPNLGSLSPSVSPSIQPGETILKIWKDFVFGGVTSEFLTELLRAKNSIAESAPQSSEASTRSPRGRNSSSAARMKSAPSEFQLSVEKALRSFAEDKEIADAKEKIVVGCLTAIKGVYFKSIAKSTVEELLEASSKVVAPSHTFNEKQKATLSEVITSLLDNKQPVANMERLLQGEHFYLRQDHDEVPPFPLSVSAETISQKVIRSRKSDKSVKSRAISPSFSEPSSEANMKHVAHLALKSHDLFHFLMKVPVDNAVWQQFIADAMSAGHHGVVLRAMQLNPDRMGLAELNWLQNSMRENNDWENFGSLLSYLHNVRMTVDEKIAFQLNARSDPKFRSSAFEGNPHLKRNAAGLSISGSSPMSHLIKHLAGAILARDGRDISQVRLPKEPEQWTLIFLPDSDFAAFAESFLQACLNENSTLSLRAALGLVKDLKGLCSMSEETVKNILLHRKMKTFVVKNKWLLAAQTAHSVQAKEMLFNIMLENEKYVEAQQFYEEFKLHGYVEPVDPLKIQEQREKMAQEFLSFPQRTTKIVFVDSLATINYMASYYGFEEIDVSLTPREEDSIAADAVQCEKESVRMSRLSFEEVVDAVRHNLLKFTPVSAASSSTACVKDSAERETIVSSAASLSTTPLWQPANPRGFRNIVGLDSEWKVEMYANTSSEGAGILQLASPGHVFVVDLFKLGEMKKLSDEESARVFNSAVAIIRQIFADKSLLKLGFDFYMEDIKMIRRAGMGAFQDAVSSIESIFDIQDALSKSSSHFDLTNTSSASVKEGLSLSEACRRYLGKPLSKTCQISDWNRRPLAEDQLFYASLDAHCLIGILDSLLLENSIDCGLQIAAEHYGVDDVIERNMQVIKTLKRG